MKHSNANVVVAIPTNGNNGREMMSGIFDYVNALTDWSVHIINSRTDIGNSEFHDSLKNVDGLILAIAQGSTGLVDRLTSENPRLKMVVANDHLVPLFAGHPNCRTLLVDSVAVGKDAAQYFNSLGRFASYGFVHGAIRYPWSSEREEGFRAAMSRNTPLFVFPPHAGRPASTVFQTPTPDIPRGELAEWLKSLPKPSAVFGANDLFAMEVLTVCAQTGIKVPGQVSVAGCDNDPFIWRNTRPLLSSFQLPHHELGHKAAQTLDRLLRGRKTPQQTIRVTGTHLFERGSTAHIPPATTLVARARDYIAEHAFEGIHVADVAAHVGVSRSLLDLRFRQVREKSVLDEILDVRLAEVRRQLVKTTHTILRIGRDCGFNDPDHLKRTFKARYGVTMRQFRSSQSP